MMDTMGTIDPIKEFDKEADVAFIQENETED